MTCSMLCTAAAGSAAGGRDILVLGSVNMDITVDVERLPLKGETTTSRTHTVSLAVGGKVLSYVGGGYVCCAVGQCHRQHAVHTPLTHTASSIMPVPT